MFTALLKRSEINILKILRVRTFSVSAEPTTYAVSHVENQIANITMCHKQTRNSLSLCMMEDLIKKISQHESDSNVRVIVLGAEGSVFSAGHNLKELSLDHGREQQIQVFKLAAQLMSKIIDSSLPIIAKVDGLAAAAGCQLVAQCDLAFCSNTSTFSTPGANFGIFCSTPGVALARSVPKSTALKMLLTGLPITAQEAEATGLVTKVSTNLDEDIKSTCEAIKTKSRSVIALGKRFYYKQIVTDVKKAYEMGAEIMVNNLQIEDGQEGIQSFIGKRKPMWKHC